MGVIVVKFIFLFTPFLFYIRLVILSHISSCQIKYDKDIILIINIVIARDKGALGCPIGSAIKLLICHHLGSVVFGALVITAVKLPRMILMWLHKKWVPLMVYTYLVCVVMKLASRIWSKEQKLIAYRNIFFFLYKKICFNSFFFKEKHTFWANLNYIHMNN